MTSVGTNEYLNYKITCISSGKSYIGATSRSLKHRWQGHVRDARCQRRKTAIAEAIREHGHDAFEIVVLETHDTREAAALREREMILEYNTLSPDGYNLDRGGEMLGGYTRVPEIRAKLSAAARRRWLGGKHNPMNLPEVRAKHRAAVKIAMNRPDVKIKLSAARKTAWADLERLAKISGENNPAKRADVKAKMSAAMKIAWARRRANDEDLKRRAS